MTSRPPMTGAMRRFCLEHPQAKMSGRDTFFAFRIDTSRYRYYLRLFPQKQKFFLFCYQTDQFKKDRPTPDYEQALNIISEYVETELTPPPIHQKSNKKKARDAHER